MQRHTAFTPRTAGRSLQLRVQKSQQYLRFRIAQAEAALEMAFVGANRLRRQHDVQPLLQKAGIPFNEFRVHRQRRLSCKHARARILLQVFDDIQQAIDRFQVRDQLRAIRLQP